MGSSSSKPSSSSKSKRRPSLGGPKGYYDYNLPVPQGYWPTANNYYGYPPPQARNYGPVVPPPPISQYPPYYPPEYPHPQPVIPHQAISEHIEFPQPVTRHPRKPVPKADVWTAPAPVQPAPEVVEPIPQPAAPPAPVTRREPHRSKKRKPTRKKLPTAIITFETPPEKENHTAPPQAGVASAPADLSRRLSAAPSSQHGRRATSPSENRQVLISSPARSTHERRGSAHSSSPQPTSAHAPYHTTQEPRPHNPLPKVPEDIFAKSPYNKLFKNLEPMPSSAPAFAPGQTYIVEHTEEIPQAAKKGLFGLKKKQPSTIRQTKYVYVPTPTAATTGNPPPMSATSSNPPPVSAASSTSDWHQPPPTSGTSANPFPTPAATSEGTHPSFHQQSPPGAAQSFLNHESTERELNRRDILFNQDTEYAPLLNHSPYPVSYERVTYPTATHLLEAMKFLPEAEHNQGIAEVIRTCEDTADVYRISIRHADAQNDDDEELYLQKMERVMRMKFNQHAELRELLLSTGDAHLVYDDPSDSYWGNGETADQQPGRNELGELMERVRARLR